MLVPLGCYSVMKLKESPTAPVGERICVTSLARISKIAAGIVATLTENNFAVYCVILDVHLNYKEWGKKNLSRLTELIGFAKLIHLRYTNVRQLKLWWAGVIACAMKVAFYCDETLWYNFFLFVLKLILKSPCLAGIAYWLQANRTVSAGWGLPSRVQGRRQDAICLSEDSNRTVAY